MFFASFLTSLFAAVRVVAVVASSTASPARAAAPGDSLAPFTLRFRATVDADAFQCGKTYTNIGTTKASVSASDFRFYVHDIRLVNAKGDTVRASLAPVTPWADKDVALLDFEDGTGACSNGTPELRQEVALLAPADTYRGVIFALGVPFTRNHGDMTAQGAPLSLSRLFWSWNAGHKFLRIDMRATQGDSAATAWVVHLGSAGCTGASSAASAPTQCTNANRAQVQLANFDLTSDVVVADLAALLARADVRRNQPQTAAGCMSAPNDADCGGLFASLGLSHPSSTGADTPKFFRAAKASAVRATTGSDR